MTVICYSDASYDLNTGIAVCGYCVIAGGKLIKHDNFIVEKTGNCGSAEVFAAMKCLEYAFLIPNVSNIILHTDYKNTVHWFSAKLYKKQRKNMYSELAQVVEIILEKEVSIQINHVKGHNNNKYNHLVDTNCRSTLRTYLKNKRNGSEAA